jgi:DNA polymerase-3 subunit epsilon
MKNLNLQRPLVIFDLETTGIDVDSDRIVEISAVRVEPDGSQDVRTRRINPERPIPAAATAVHGISDDDVRDEPAFRKLGRGLLKFLEGADLAGYNVARFDVPLLEREMKDCGLDLEVGQRRIIDAMTIFHRKEPRDLSAAVRFFLGRDHEGAHSAEADVAATLEILEAELERYDDLPRDVESLAAWILRIPADAVDGAGKFVWREGDATFAFGKHQGKTLREVAASAPGYLEWIVGSDFPADARELVRRALLGEFPEERRKDRQST